MIPEHAALFVVACTWGFVTYSKLSAPKAGAPNRLDEMLKTYTGYTGGVSLRFHLPLGYVLHIHHWLCA